MTTAHDRELLAAALALGVPALAAREAVATVHLDHHDGTQVVDDVGATWDARVQAWRIGTRTDGRAVWVAPMLYTHAIIIGPPDDAGAYDDRWCYDTKATATAAAVAWLPTTAPEPTGWHRHPTTGRRRPGGDPAREYVEQ